MMKDSDGNIGWQSSGRIRAEAYGVAAGGDERLMARRRRQRRFGAMAVGWIALALLAAVSVWFFLVPKQPRQPVFVEIAPGSSATQIADALEEAGVVRSRWAFVAMHLWRRRRLKAGEYQFERLATLGEVYRRIARGDVFTIAVTIPEGMDRQQIGEKLARAGLGTEEGFLEATRTEVSRIHDLDPEAANLEGYLFPDTYRFGRRATDAEMVDAMVRQFRREARSLGLTEHVHEVVTLASIVEKETAVSEERPMVASVLVNRLAKRMPLMTDPAVIYGLRERNEWRGAIYASDLSDASHDTPYNTYRHAGLPPGPISNPGLDSLRAAMHPAKTDYIYFVAAGDDPQGRSLFASTLEEHQKNVAIYRKAKEREMSKQAGSQ